MAAEDWDGPTLEDRPSAKVTWTRRHATGLTVFSFFAIGGMLSVLPEKPLAAAQIGGADISEVSLPLWLRPIDLTSGQKAQNTLARIFDRPQMTFTKANDPGLLPEDDADDTTTEALIASLPEAAPPPQKDPTLASALEVDPALAAEEKLKGRLRGSTYPTSREADLLVQLARRLGASGAPIDNPCLAYEAERCVRTALDPFFVSLDQLRDDRASAHDANVVILGNSLIASDHLTDVVRERLSEQFGNGGRGFLLVDRLSKVAGRRVRTGRGTPGWEIHTVAAASPNLPTFGYAGSAHESSGPRDLTRWRLDGARSAQLFWLDHDGAPTMTLMVDGKKLGTLKSKNPVQPTDEITDIDLPAGAKTLTLKVAGKGAVFTRQLKARDPSLVALMMGGNEIRYLSFGRLTPKKAKADFSALVDRIQKAVPDAACLVVTPIDNVKATAAGAELRTRKELGDFIMVQKEVAQEKGCAFFNIFEAMGGRDSLGSFHRAGLIHADLVHPRGKGGDVLGELFSRSLFASYSETPRPDESGQKKRLRKPRLLGLADAAGAGLRATSAGQHSASDSLVNFFEKLRQLESKGRRRVAIGQFGSTHTAAEVLTDRVRDRLSERFGDRGRGLISVGDFAPELMPGRIVRRLEGPVDLIDGRKVILGGALNPSGARARLGPGGSFTTTFCEGCRESSMRPPGVVEIAYLHTPDMGVADVFINDVLASQLHPGLKEDSGSDTDVQVLRIPVRGQSHRVVIQVKTDAELKAEAEERLKAYEEARALVKDESAEELEEPEPALSAGPVHLFSVAAEVERPGMVLDTHGLAHSTGMTMQRWQQNLVGAQVKKRAYDLLVFAWGEEEVTLSNLDDKTYRHHLEKTMDTLIAASPDAECLVMGPPDRWVPKKDGTFKAAPRQKLVTRVQRALAAAKGCAFFDTAKAMGGSGSMKHWVEEGLAESDHLHFAPDGYRRLADALVRDLLALYEYDTALIRAQALAAAEAQKENDVPKKEGRK
jgi:lysophospholipase L1-like esterase